MPHKTSALQGSVPCENARHIPSAHEMQYFVYRITGLTPTHVQRFTRFGMDVYCPMQAVQQQGRHGTITHYVSRTAGYLFAHTTRTMVDNFAAEQGIRPLYTHRVPDVITPNEMLYVTVPRTAMHIFMGIMDAIQGHADMDTPTQQQLAKGDTVLILQGPLAGIQGTLLSNQGSRARTIHVRLTQGLGINLRIPGSEVAIISFSRQGNHVTTHLRAIEQHMSAILQHYSQHHAITTDMATWLTRHIQRYGRLTGLTHAMAARYTVHLSNAHHLLGQHQQAQHIMHTYRQSVAHSPRARRSAGRTPTSDQYIQHWTALLTKS